MKPIEFACFSIERGSSFCSLKGAFLQNEDPIDFTVLAPNNGFQHVLGLHSWLFGLPFVDTWMILALVDVPQC